VNVSQHRRKDAPIARQRWSTLAFTAIGLLFAQPAAHAAGFGQLRVQSSLGQPLQAEIDISGVTPEDTDNLAVKLAPPDAYAKAGLTYLPAVSGVRLQLERRPNGSYVAKVRSNQPVSEPFVDILIDMTWSSGKVSRAYTFLLDPVGSTQANQPVAPTPIVQAATPEPLPAPAAVAPPPVAAAPAPAPAPAPAAPARQAGQPRAPQASPSAGASGDSYTVRRGDNLYGIAGEVAQGQDEISLDQMLVALYRANPGAFIGGNMNRLRAGAVLKVPSQQQAQAVTPRQARREVVAHTQGFDAYRSRLATAAAASKPEAGSGREQSGNVTARVQEQSAPAAGPRDELKLSKPEAGAQAPNALAEANVAKDRQLKEAEARMAQLEKNVGDMQRLLELKNAEIARLAQSNAAKGATPAPSAPSASQAPQVVAAGNAGDSAAAPATAAAPAPEALASASAPATPAAAATQAAASAPATDATAQSANASAPAVQPPLVVQADPVPSPSFIDDLIANPLTLPGGGLVLALLGGYVIYRSRRKQKEGENAAFENSILSQESTMMAGSNSLFGTAGGQSVDTSQHSVFGADFRIGNNVAEAHEVDPIAEAEVYIAYGRDAQAEEILREALSREPGRQAIRLKLLEIYSNRQDVEGFRVIAEEMFAQTGGHGVEWMQAAEMGRVLEPGNALYLAVTPDADGGEPTTAAGDQWRTQDPSLEPGLPPREAALGDLALPLDAFPAPAPGAPITAPESAARAFGNPDGFPGVRLDDEADPGLDDASDPNAGVPRLDETTRARPLDFDMSGISLDMPEAPSAQPSHAPAQGPAVSHDESAAPLPAPTLLRDGKLVEPLDLSHFSSASAPDTVSGISPTTMSVDTLDGGRDMQIKFDLAKAYIEIGDKEGARELLQEVVDQSADPLRSEARHLLAEVA
jgi:pilus assembly protein FimV